MAMAAEYYFSRPQGSPSLKPSERFNAEQDAEGLRKAMKGLGTDEVAIIKILGQRSFVQRLAIVRQFKSMYGKDLVAELHSELSGKFRQVCKLLCVAPMELDASELRRAMKGLGTDEDVLIEILCTRSNAEKAAIIDAYSRLFKRDLEKDIISETSGDFKNLLVSLLQCNRSESFDVDRGQVQDDVHRLHEAGEQKWGTDEGVFNQIMVTRSFTHLRAVFYQYGAFYEKTMDKVIASEMSGDLKKGMLTIVRVIQNTPGYFAEALHKSMKGLGTDDDTLLRIVITRCEVDMEEIKNQFLAAYGKTLGDFIKGDTSGDYRKILMLLISDFS